MDSELAGANGRSDILPPDHLQDSNFCSTSLCVPRCGRVPPPAAHLSADLDSKSRKKGSGARQESAALLCGRSRLGRGRCVGGLRVISRMGRLDGVTRVGWCGAFLQFFDFFLCFGDFRLFGVDLILLPVQIRRSLCI